MLKSLKTKSNVCFIFYLLVFSLMSCADGQSSSKRQKQNPGPSAYNLELSKRDLDGIWGVDTRENSDFEIKGDSLIYTEHRDTPFFLKVIGDTIKVDLDGVELLWIVRRLNDDSLVVSNQLGTVITYRRFIKRP